MYGDITEALATNWFKSLSWEQVKKAMADIEAHLVLIKANTAWLFFFVFCFALIITTLFNDTDYTRFRIEKFTT